MGFFFGVLGVVFIFLFCGILFIKGEEEIFFFLMGKVGCSVVVGWIGCGCEVVR